MAKALAFGFEAELPIFFERFAIERGVIVKCDAIKPQVRSDEALVAFAVQMAALNVI